MLESGFQPEPPPFPFSLVATFINFTVDSILSVAIHLPVSQLGDWTLVRSGLYPRLKINITNLGVILDDLKVTISAIVEVLYDFERDLLGYGVVADVNRHVLPLQTTSFRRGEKRFYKNGETYFTVAVYFLGLSQVTFLHMRNTFISKA